MSLACCLGGFHILRIRGLRDVLDESMTIVGCPVYYADLAEVSENSSRLSVSSRSFENVLGRWQFLDRPKNKGDRWISASVDLNCAREDLVTRSLLFTAHFLSFNYFLRWCLISSSGPQASPVHFVKFASKHVAHLRLNFQKFRGV